MVLDFNYEARSHFGHVTQPPRIVPMRLNLVCKCTVAFMGLRRSLNSIDEFEGWYYGHNASLQIHQFNDLRRHINATVHLHTKFKRIGTIRGG